MALDPRATRQPYTPAPRSAGVSAEPSPEPIAGATAAEMARTRFGGPTRVESSTFTLTTAVQQVLDGNPRRVFWTIINRGVVNAAVDIDAGMTYANGTPLGAGGGFASMDVQEDGESVGWAVYGATESGTAVVRLLQVMRV